MGLGRGRFLLRLTFCETSTTPPLVPPAAIAAEEMGMPEVMIFPEEVTTPPLELLRIRPEAEDALAWGSGVGNKEVTVELFGMPME